MLHERSGRRVPDQVLQHYLNNKDSNEHLVSTPHGRIIIDFLSGMTDGFLLDQFKMRFLPQDIGQFADEQS